MNSQKLLIISVVAALLIVAGAIFFVKSRNSTSTDLPVTTINGDQIVIDEIMASCKSNDQCIVVDTKCSFCCDYVAINAKSEVLFNQMFDMACKKYKGTYCDCHDLTSYPTCVSGKCQMVKWSENKTLKAPPPPQAQKQTAPVTPVQQQAPQAQTPIPQPAPQAAPPQEQKQTVPTLTPAPRAIPAPVAPPQPATPVQQTPAPASDAFGEDEVAPVEQAPPADDDLFAPLPKTFTPQTEGQDVEVIRP